MKNFAKLVLFFSLSFIAFLLIAILLEFTSSWIEFARIMPIGAKPVEEAAELVWKALPAALYLAILLTQGYSARNKMPIPSSMICIILMAFVFTAFVSLGIGRTEALNVILKPLPPVEAESGLILSRSENMMVLLRESSDSRGSRVVSIPDLPLIYQEVPIGPNDTIISLPSLPFQDDTPWFIKSISIDFSLSARELKDRIEANLLFFVSYAFSLVLLLSSLRFILEVSMWPFANLFLGALVFRGILALETFLNAREINTLIASFLDGRIPPLFITPVIFAALGILIILYTLLTRIARPARSRDD
jgi:hypothetical protein